MRQQIRDRVKEVVELAADKYGFSIPASAINISFTNRGGAAGQAMRRFDQYSLKFSLESANVDPSDMLNDTIPHEIAHLVCFFDPSLGRNHDHGWKRVCIGLGGSGKRTHSQTLTKGRYRTQYLYRMPSGREFETGVVRHRKIQNGAVYTFRGGDKMRAEHFVRVITPEEHRNRHQQKVAAYAAKNQSDVATTKATGSTSHKRPASKKPARKRMSTGMSKLDICRNVWRNSASHDRQVMISKFVEAGCTPAGASSYYSKLKKELGV